MSIRGAGALILLIGAMTCAIAGNVVIWRMVDEVNRQLPEGMRFDQFGWHPAKLGRLTRAYRRLCPTGTRVKQMGYLAAAMFVLMGGSAVLLGVFS